MFRHCGGFGGDRRTSEQKLRSLNRSNYNDDTFDVDSWDFDAVDGSENSQLDRLFVLEVVGSLGLSSIADDVDTFCILSKTSSEGEKKVFHKTDVICNDTAPIWTLKTKSTCFVDLEPQSSEKLIVELCQKTIGIPGMSDVTVIGEVELTYATLLANGDSKRREYTLANDRYPGILLALRFRKGTLQDFLAFRELTENTAKPSIANIVSTKKIANTFIRHPRTIIKPLSSSQLVQDDNAGDIDFEFVTAKRLLGNQKFVEVNGRKEKAYRVWPFPDPDSPEDTAYMTKGKIKKLANEPSRQWVEAAGGASDNYGSVYLEVLGCDDLPNMDHELIDGLTDAFVACVYEDNFVRTPIIHDSLNPRWMPWSHRAFKFHIQHPSSILRLGVFDYDDNPLDSHDPIGRIVIIPTLYEEDTMYTLTYPLQYEDQCRGSLTLRLRIHWHDSADASRAECYLRPPRFIINVKSFKSWKTLRYLTRGETDMSDVTIDSVKLYATEVKEHWQRLCYFLDVLAHLMLWRMPIHSFIIFVGMMAAIQFPMYLVSIVLYLLAYALLCNNYYLSTHPSPWSRVRSFARVAFRNHFKLKQKVFIAPKTGAQKSEELRRLNEYKGLRVMSFLYEAIIIALKIYRVYSKTTPVDLSTISKSGSIFSRMYASYLSYAHVILRMICRYSRQLRNFVNWRSGSAYKLTIDLLMIATVWAVFPYKCVAVRYASRAIIVAFLGPQNKIIDHLWIRSYYRTKEDLLHDGIPETVEEMKQEIASRQNILDKIFVSKWAYELGKSGRVTVEDNVKLQAAREIRYGHYSETVPIADTSRFASVPASESSAQAYERTFKGKCQEGHYEDIDPELKIWRKVPGQKLNEDILPQPVSNYSSLPSEITL